MWSLKASLRRLAVSAIILGGLAFCALVFGFMLFASHVMREPAWNAPRADAIVVLTGGDQRIEEAARLLAEGRGRRLLVSGVNRRNTKDDMRRLIGLKTALFECCVDLGYNAQDTIGNASETRRWAQDWQYSRLIIVTASYHMPRSMIELSRQVPDVEFIPHPVLPRQIRGGPWWLNMPLMRLLLAEYAKFLPAAAKLAASRWITPPSARGLTAERVAPGGAG
jgi:uncharacterized SAM-binding protein YcdF (DUF218 family)